jgi:hypothetical protein
MSATETVHNKGQRVTWVARHVCHYDIISVGRQREGLVKKPTNFWSTLDQLGPLLVQPKSFVLLPLSPWSKVDQEKWKSIIFLVSLALFHSSKS